MECFKLANGHSLVLDEVEVDIVTVESVDAHEGQDLAVVTDHVDYFQCLLRVGSGIDLVIRQILIIPWCSDHLHFQCLLNLSFHQFPHFQYTIRSLFPLVMGREIASNQHTVHIAHLLLDILQPALEQSHRSVALGTAILLGLAGTRVREAVLRMTANGEIADDGAVDGVVEIEMDVSHMQKLCITLVDFDLPRREGQLIDVLEYFNGTVVDDVVDLCLQVETGIEAFGAKSSTHPSCLQNASVSHSDGERGQLIGNLLTQLSGFICIDGEVHCRSQTERTTSLATKAGVILMREFWRISLVLMQVSQREADARVTARRRRIIDFMINLIL